MAWDFSFCGPFLPNDTSFNSNRYLLFGILAFEMLIFTFVRTVASCVYKGRAITVDIDTDYQVRDIDNTSDKIAKNENGTNFDEKDVQYNNTEHNMEKIASNESTFNNTSPPGSRDIS